MKHLIISREYPLAPYPAGGIGSYVDKISRLLAERGETVHVIGQRWSGAPLERETRYGDRLIIHRIGENDLPKAQSEAKRLMHELEGLKRSVFPEQWFAWHTAFLAERIIEEEEIDVIEGQDWEAPLYFFLLRRSLGLGPSRRPPCILQLHSTSEFIQRANGYLPPPRSYPVMKRMEEFCIHAADALLCPSQYFARQCSEHYGLSLERIRVISLPIGFTPFLERDTRTWAEGSICYVGRMEPRKGIIEWVEAAARIASVDAKVHFDFVGEDKALKRALLARIPRGLRARFRFHGQRTHREILSLLARSKAAVVPSRWENFPNVCIEAMSSGLPVIATRLGGMSELIEDERTGWLAPDTGVAGIVDGLASALRRCVDASAHRRAEMGRLAADIVRQRCDNDQVMNQQIAFRTEVVHLGAERSLPPHTPARLGAEQNQTVVTTQASSKGAGIIIRVDSIEDAKFLIGSIWEQTLPPGAVAIVCAIPTTLDDAWTKKLMASGVTLLRQTALSGPAAWNAGLSAVRERVECAFWLFLDQHDLLLPNCLEQICEVFDQRPDVGIVSPWTRRTGGQFLLEANPSPTPYYQIAENDVTPASAFRDLAIRELSPFRVGMPREFDIWDIANMVMAKGWTAVTYPQILAERSARKPNIAWPEASALRSLREANLSHFSCVFPRIAFDLIDDYVPLPMVAEPLRDRAVRYLVTALLHPQRARRWIVRRSREVYRTVGFRFGFRDVRPLL